MALQPICLHCNEHSSAVDSIRGESSEPDDNARGICVLGLDVCPVIRVCGALALAGVALPIWLANRRLRYDGGWLCRPAAHRKSGGGGHRSTRVWAVSGTN